MHTCNCVTHPVDVAHYLVTVVVVCDEHPHVKRRDKPSDYLTLEERYEQCLCECSGISPTTFGQFDFVTMTLYISGSLPAQRQRETMLHELGHVICWSLDGVSGDGGEAGANAAALWLSAVPRFTACVIEERCMCDACLVIDQAVERS